MFRRFRRTGALGACAVAAVAFAGAAAVPAYAHDDGGNLDFTLYAKEVPGPGSNSSGPPPKVGQVLTFADDYYTSKSSTDTVGRDGVTCGVVRVSGDSADVNCVGTIVLNGGPGGQITAQALTHFDTSNETGAAFDIAVTGGTGDFKNAHGYIRSTPDGDFDRMDFHITR
ncbi:allene oxide cyclase barrel-like domain-containing protein [Streptomyces sp. NPDC004788]